MVEKNSRGAAGDGQVGIGTTSPGRKLDVVGTARISSSLEVGADFAVVDKILHTGDTNTAIRFPANDTFTIDSKFRTIV